MTALHKATGVAHCNNIFFACMHTFFAGDSCKEWPQYSGMNLIQYCKTPLLSYSLRFPCRFWMEILEIYGSLWKSRLFTAPSMKLPSCEFTGQGLPTRGKRILLTIGIPMTFGLQAKKNTSKQIHRKNSIGMGWFWASCCEKLPLSDSALQNPSEVFKKKMLI